MTNNPSWSTADPFRGGLESLLQNEDRKFIYKVMDKIPMLVYMQRPDYSIAYANKLVRKYYRIRQSSHCYTVFFGRSTPCPNCCTFKVFATGCPHEWQYSDAAGRTFHLYDYPFEEENGEPVVVEIGIDITDSVQMENRLFQARTMLDIGVLAGGMAHDLNNDLLPIIHNIEYALGRVRDERAAEALRESLCGAYRASALVNSVQEYSRRQSVGQCVLDVSPVVAEGIRMARADMPENIKLTVSSKADGACIKANATQIQQVILNLCRNAVQAMPDGGELRVETFIENSKRKILARGLPLNRYLACRVSDTGYGIARDKIKHIFEPFYTTKRRTGGTGMGLAIVHAIVASTNGHIFVESQENSGTSFSVYLPLASRISKRQAYAQA
jgi:signal transduction histidine kinase